MKITAIEDLHCDAGWRDFSFLKISTDAGIVGYSEYNESYGTKGLTGVIRKLSEKLVDEDPRPVELISAQLYAKTRQAPNGITQQAIAAIVNALVDIKAKSLDLSVSELLGGPCRTRLPLYWSHCGSYLMQHAELCGVPSVRSLDDIKTLGKRVADTGFKALKTNIFVFDADEPYMHMPGFTRTAGWPELNAPDHVIGALDEQLTAFREGAGPDVKFLVDLNFNFKTEGYLQVGRMLEKHDLFWVEIDMFNPEALAHIRRSLNMPLASCESLYGRREFRPFLENQSMDVAIVDVPWNGILESVKIANMAEAYEVNCAPHNFYGHLSTLMSAHFCAAIPNFRVMEIDIDDVPWKDDLVTQAPVIENGELILPDGPGWGADLNEEVVRAHPPKGR